VADFGGQFPAAGGIAALLADQKPGFRLAPGEDMRGNFKFEI